MILLDYFIIALKGVAMGAADAVPGVSGGTIAFISGIYEELISSIDKINLNVIKVWKKEGFLAYKFEIVSLDGEVVADFTHRMWVDLILPCNVSS